MEELKLKKVNAYAMVSSDDEWKSSIKGYFKDSNIASTKAKGAGWYGSDGSVESVELWHDETTDTLYTLQKAGNGKFADVDAKYREETIASIKSKLSKEELELLGL